MCRVPGGWQYCMQHITITFTSKWSVFSLTIPEIHSHYCPFTSFPSHSSTINRNLDGRSLYVLVFSEGDKWQVAIVHTTDYMKYNKHKNKLHPLPIQPIYPSKAYLTTCFLALPTTVLLTLVANRKLHKDSPRWAASGDRLHIIKVLLEPVYQLLSFLPSVLSFFLPFFLSSFGFLSRSFPLAACLTVITTFTHDDIEARQ